MSTFLRRMAAKRAVQWIVCVAFTVALTWWAAYCSYSSIGKGMHPSLLGAVSWATHNESGWIFAVLAAMVLWLSLRLAGRLGNDVATNQSQRSDVRHRAWIWAVAFASFVCGALAVKLFEHIWYG
jgi:hypothetical protein